jgi:uncharacterized membrane protein required for colicin V production
VFVGFTQGAIRYLLNSVAVLVAFVLAAQLKGPLVDLLGFWTAFSPPVASCSSSSCSSSGSSSAPG